MEFAWKDLIESAQTATLGRLQSLVGEHQFFYVYLEEKTNHLGLLLIELW